jgi:hypothetical protein
MTDGLVPADQQHSQQCCQTCLPMASDRNWCGFVRDRPTVFDRNSSVQLLVTRRWLLFVSLRHFRPLRV